LRSASQIRSDLARRIFRGALQLVGRIILFPEHLRGWRARPRGATHKTTYVKITYCSFRSAFIISFLILCASAQLHERSCFFAQLSANSFSSCSCLCLVDRIFKHQFSDFMLDGDCRGKLEFSSKPMRVRCALLWRIISRAEG
jgi:hypothetical protein